MSRDALFGLEPSVWKLTWSVLRGACGLVTVLWGGNAPRLPDSLINPDTVVYTETAVLPGQ